MEVFSDLQLEELITNPRETLDVEIKGWIDLNVDEQKANLAKAILALANHGGGFVVVGFREEQGLWISDTSIIPTKGYSQDLINGIVESYATPSFQCQVKFVKKDNKDYPVILVPGDHNIPIRSRRAGPNQKHVTENQYYIRRPGPKSESPQTADEWNQLIGRCIRASRTTLIEEIRTIFYGFETIGSKKLVDDNIQIWHQNSEDRWSNIIKEKLPNESPSRFQYGFWSFSYKINGKYVLPSLTEFKEILEKAKGSETGWPPWWVPTREAVSPYVYNKLIECLMISEKDKFKDAAHSDFWRADPQGKLFILRGYQEDSSDETEPGKAFFLIIPVWRVGECLLHIHRLCELLNVEKTSSVSVNINWKGLKGRKLKTLRDDRNWDIYQSFESKQDEVSSYAEVPLNQIDSNLPEITKHLLSPLYESFDFYKPGEDFFQRELKRMRRK